jgi:molybdate transport system substrate-binding protein
LLLVRSSLLLLVTAVVGCVPGARAVEPRDLTVAAAANLRPALEELSRAFEAEHRGVRVHATYGASGGLYAQIASGAPMDVFLSADRDYPRRLVEAGLASGESVYALGPLALWLAAPAQDGAPRGLPALADPAIRRVAIANPRVAPYGRAAEAALQAAGLQRAVTPKLVLGESVGQAAQLAASGAADAAILPTALAREVARSGGQAFPLAGAPPLEQSGAVLARSRSPALARAFVSFLQGTAARAILARHGYALP